MWIDFKQIDVSLKAWFCFCEIDKEYSGSMKVGNFFTNTIPTWMNTVLTECPISWKDKVTQDSRQLHKL
jgi:hypothetical protein